MSGSGTPLAERCFRYGAALSRVSAINPGRKCMKKKLAVSLVTGIALASALGASPAVAVTVAMCTPTGFIRDGMNLTAKVIADGDISGTIDATGCNIGIYYGQRSLRFQLLWHRRHR